MSIDGILNIIKPKGITSFQVVSLVRRLSRERRVGHSGTLDPEASGVLPVCLGQGTRIIPFLVGMNKTYLAEIELGLSTDTYDASGKIMQTGDPSKVTRDQIEKALDSFRGAIEQRPPAYSAIRYKGKHLYELARMGVQVEIRKRKVQIFRLELLEWCPPCFTLEVECSTGTYIRSLAYDLGQILGCGAYLKDLVRLKCGIFHIEEALSLSAIEEAFHHGYWQSFIYPIDEVLLPREAAIVGVESEKAIREGRSLSLGRKGNDFPCVSSPGGQCRAYSTDGRFLAVLGFYAEKGLWHPEKVFCVHHKEI